MAGELIGRRVTLTIVRGGRTITLELVPEELEA